MKVKEKVMEIVFLVAACVSILAVLLICVFLFSSGIPAIGKIGPLNFLGGTVWKPSNNLFGILPMILGSIYVTAGAIIIGVPIGIFMAVFMARFCPGSLYKILKPAVELLAGIPSIVYVSLVWKFWCHCSEIHLRYLTAKVILCWQHPFC